MNSDEMRKLALEIEKGELRDREEGLGGIRNSLWHQRMIAETLAYVHGVYQSRNVTKRMVYSELSLSSLSPYPNPYGQGFAKNYNYDIAVIDDRERLRFVLEIEDDSIADNTIDKLVDSLRAEPALEEAMILRRNVKGEVEFCHVTANGRSYSIKSGNSYSEYLKLDLKEIVEE